MKLEDYIVIAGLLNLAIGFVASWLPSNTLVGLVLILMGFVTGSETLKKEEPEPLSAAEVRFAAPCGLYCGACIDYLVHKSCHGCGCQCGKCDSLEHHRQCDIYHFCVEQKGLKACHECEEFPCSRLTQFCYNPVWLHHLTVIENLRRQKTVGTERWLKEQKEVWKNEWYLRRWLWFQKECENRLKQSLEESTSLLGEK